MEVAVHLIGMFALLLGRWVFNLDDTSLKV